MLNYFTERCLFKELALGVLIQASKDAKNAKNALQILDIKEFVYSSYFDRLCDIACVNPKKKRKEILADLTPNYAKKVFKRSVTKFFGNECGHGIDHVISTYKKLGFISGVSFTENEILCVKKKLEMN